MFSIEKRRERTKVNNLKNTEDSISDAKILFEKVLKEEKEKEALKEMIEDLSFKKMVSYVPLPKHRLVSISTARGSTIDTALKEKLQRETEFLKSMIISVYFFNEKESKKLFAKKKFLMNKKLNKDSEPRLLDGRTHSEEKNRDKFAKRAQNIVMMNRFIQLSRTEKQQSADSTLKEEN